MDSGKYHCSCIKNGLLTIPQAGPGERLVEEDCADIEKLTRFVEN